MPVKIAPPPPLTVMAQNYSFTRPIIMMVQYILQILLNGAWTPIKKLNKNINTKFYESHASISSDGKKLYFTSNREGGQGNLDIYVSEKDESGDWGPAVNLGAAINTPFNEDTPFITENDSMLYFSSEGHSSMGGFDNFKSQKSGNQMENTGKPWISHQHN